MKRILPLLIILLSSCSVIKEMSMTETYRNEFLGHTTNYIIDVCGEPTTTRPDGNDGKVLVYENIEKFIDATGIAVNENTVIEGNFVQIYIGPDEKCYSIRTNHVEKHKEINYKKSWLAVGTSLGSASIAASIASIIFSLLLL